MYSAAYNTVLFAGVAVSAYPPPFQHTGRYVETSFSLPGGYVETSFNVTPGTLKLEKGQFQVTSPSFMQITLRGYVETSFSVPGGTLKLVSKYLPVF